MPTNGTNVISIAQQTPRGKPSLKIRPDREGSIFHNCEKFYEIIAATKPNNICSFHNKPKNIAVVSCNKINSFDAFLLATSRLERVSVPAMQILYIYIKLIHRQGCPRPSQPVCHRARYAKAYLSRHSLIKSHQQATGNFLGHTVRVGCW